MSFRRIINPYRIWVSDKAVAAGFPRDASFPNKAKAREFIKRVQQVDPDFNPILRTATFKYEDTISGKVYRNKFEYAKDQQAHEEFMRKEEERRKAEAIVHEKQMEEFWKSYEPIFEAHEKKMAGASSANATERGLAETHQPPPRAGSTRSGFFISPKETNAPTHHHTNAQGPQTSVKGQRTGPSKYSKDTGQTKSPSSGNCKTFHRAANEKELALTKEEAKKILRELHDHHNKQYGIRWEDITSLIQEYGMGRDLTKRELNQFIHKDIITINQTKIIKRKEQMNTTTELEQITLYYREGSSDKVYQCAIEPAGNRFVVNFAYGRRGTTLNTGTKTNVPVDFDSAKRIYDKLVREKKAKGYTEGEDGTPYQQTDNESEVSGIQCQLLNPIDEQQLAMLLNDSEHCAQEKFDGRRTLIQKTGPLVSGVNRKGLWVGLPLSLVLSAEAITG